MEEYRSIGREAFPGRKAVDVKKAGWFVEVGELGLYR
jgi:hypothetical protein